MHIGYLNFALAVQELTLGMPTSKRLANGHYEVAFHCRPAAPAKSVALVGTFTDWKERPLAMTGPDALGNYSTTFAFDPGSHEYKFLINGETFRHDPGNPEFAGFFQNSLIGLP
jgi:1,4-alpha-glucan branching enzyme